jgi:hypothetical protein
MRSGFNGEMGTGILTDALCNFQKISWVWGVEEHPEGLVRPVEPAEIGWVGQMVGEAG